MGILTAALFLFYLVLLGAKAEGLTLVALEVVLDVTVIALAARRRWYLVAGAFAASLISTTNFQVVSRVFDVKLPSTMGTWLEIEINVPYITCYALAALALVRAARDSGRKQAPTAGAMLSLIAIGLTLACLLPGLTRTGYPMQNRALHVVCFAVSGVIYGFGAVNMAALEVPGWPLVALGLVGLALSGLFFQITEIFPRAYALDVPMELSWTLGQFAVICGLRAASAKDQVSDTLADHRG